MIRSRALRALAALAALAWSAAAPAGEPERRYVRPPAAHPPPPGGQRVELHVRFPPWQFNGSFRLEGPAGTVLDEGVVRDEGGFTVGDGAIERVLEGSRGTLRLRLIGGAKTSTFPGIVGRWEVASGTGAWASMTGSGSFTSCSGGEPTGSPFELQTMIGYLLR
jgi:hypothetical protein